MPNRTHRILLSVFFIGISFSLGAMLITSSITLPQLRIADAVTIGTEHSKVLQQENSISNSPTSTLPASYVAPANAITTETNLAVFTTDDAPVTVSLMPNDLKPGTSNGPVTITPTFQPQHGSLSVNSDGTVTYFPAKQLVASGTKTVDEFTYSVSVGQQLAMRGTVTVTVTETEKAPVASPYTQYVISKNSQNNYFLMPATDDNNDPLTYTVVTPPTFGYYALENDTGFLSYTPFYDYVGNDTMTFIASDGHLKTGLGTIQISVMDTSS